MTSHRRVIGYFSYEKYARDMGAVVYPNHWSVRSNKCAVFEDYSMQVPTLTGTGYVRLQSDPDWTADSLDEVSDLKVGEQGIIILPKETK